MSTIWVLHHYAQPPDGKWTASHDLASELVKKGHQVTIIAASFDHYSRKEEYLKAGQLRLVRDYDGVRFVFLRTTPYSSRFVGRVLNMVSYACMAFWEGLRASPAPDVIVGVTPHPLTPLVALLLSKIRRARFFFEVRDLWPLFLVEVGVLAETGVVARILYRIELLCLRKAARILTVWPGMITYVEELGVSGAKVVWTPIGQDMAQVAARHVSRPKQGNAAEHALLFMYRGGFGYSNDIKLMLDAARLVGASHPNTIRFVLAGEGPQKTEMMDYARECGLKNVEFQGFLPKAELAEALSRADVLLCSLPDVPHFERYGQIASKLIDYLAAARPILLTTHNRSSLVGKSGAGVVVPPGNPAALARSIVEIAESSEEERLQMGRKGLEYLASHHDITQIAARLESVI